MSCLEIRLAKKKWPQYNMNTLKPDQQTGKVNNVTKLQNKKKHEVNLIGEIVDTQPGSVCFPRDYREMK